MEAVVVRLISCVLWLALAPLVAVYQFFTSPPMAWLREALKDKRR